MKVPWRFLVALPLGFLVALSVFIGALYTQLGVPTHMSQWNFDMLQKKDRLAAQISGPRLLIAGGSNALFGLNAELIQQQTGWPTINLATEAGLRIDYLLYRVKKVARPGDIILLVFEYQLYLDKGSVGSEVYDDYILARDPAYFHHLSLLEKIDMATRLPFKRLQKGWHNRRTAETVRPPQPPYSPYTPITPGIDCLDDNGDEIFNTDVTQPSPTTAMQSPLAALQGALSSEDTDGFEELAAFIQWAQARQITVLATFPNVVYQPDYDAPAGQKTLAIIAHFYASHNVPVVGTAREAMLPLDQFYDTMYHLIHSAALQRTEHLIPELQPYLRPSR